MTPGYGTSSVSGHAYGPRSMNEKTLTDLDTSHLFRDAEAATKRAAESLDRLQEMDGYKMIQEVMRTPKSVRDQNPEMREMVSDIMKEPDIRGATGILAKHTGEAMKCWESVLENLPKNPQMAPAFKAIFEQTFLYKIQNADFPRDGTDGTKTFGQGIHEWGQSKLDKFDEIIGGAPKLQMQAQNNQGLNY